MANTTIVLGIILIILGLISFFITGMQSVTALIPTFFGLLILALGFLARKESARKMAIHIAMGLGLLGLIGTFSGLINLFALIGGTEVARPAAVIAQAIVAVLCIVYLILGIRSFIEARKKSV